MKNSPFLFPIIVMFFIMSACNRDERFEEQTQSQGSNVRYYKSFVSYQLPIRPAGEISASEAKKLAAGNYAYYEARYDHSGKLLSLAKHSSGEKVMIIMYAYHNEGSLEKCTITHPADTKHGKTESYFDSTGKLKLIREYNNQGKMIREERLK